MQRQQIENEIPRDWKEFRSRFENLASTERKARQKYRRNVDESYEIIVTMLKMISDREALTSLRDKLPLMQAIILNDPAEQAMVSIKALGGEFNSITNANSITSKLSRSRRALRGNNPDQEKSIRELMLAIDNLEAEISWRSRANSDLKPELQAYEQSISKTIGMRQQERLTDDQAESVASCLAVHKDISLYF